MIALDLCNDEGDNLTCKGNAMLEYVFVEKLFGSLVPAFGLTG